jgi:hypothetical protein
VAGFTHVKTWSATVYVPDAPEMTVRQRDRDQHPILPGESIA